MPSTCANTGPVLADAGPRVALALLALGLASLAVWRRVDRGARVPLYQRALVLVLPALSAASADALFLRLVPAAIQGAIAALFLVSLRGGGSLLFSAARALHPHAPEFIAPYCRKSTIVLAGVFALQGIAVAWLALDPPQRGWGFASGILVWAPVLAASLVDWIVRKSWFRYFGPGPIDQLLRRVLPPENTATGRRSLDYIRKMRAQLGMPPP